MEKTKVAIDVSLDVLDVCVRLRGEPGYKQFCNNQAGFKLLQKWLIELQITEVLLCFEATGRYWEKLAYWAIKRNWSIWVINPLNLRRFALAKNGLNKNDKADSRAILRFAEASDGKEMRLWQPKNDVQRELRDIQLEIDGIQKIIGQERNRLKCGLFSKTLAYVIRGTIRDLKKAKKRLRAIAVALVRTDAMLLKNFNILKSQKGIGDATALLLITKIDFSLFSKGRQLVSFAGLAPAEFSSGKSVHRKERISRVGHCDLRQALYFPAVVAMTHDPEIREFAAKLVANGKCKMQAICAVMARLLRTSFALIRDQRSYESRSSSAA